MSYRNSVLFAFNDFRMSNRTTRLGKRKLANAEKFPCGNDCKRIPLLGTVEKLENDSKWLQTGTMEQATFPLEKGYSITLKPQAKTLFVIYIRQYCVTF